MSKNCRNYATASARVEVCDGVPVVELRGVVGPAVFAEFVSDCARWGLGHAAMVVQWQHAVLDATPRDLAAVVRQRCAVDGALHLILAIVASADNARALRRYGHVMADAGLTRVVFDDPEKAFAWARQQATLFENEALHRALKVGPLSPAAPAPGAPDRVARQLPVPISR